jgi:hypothetical protein
MPLQKRVVDFGSDVPFHDVPKKLNEHYGFELCSDVIRKITLKHAEQAGSFFEEANDLPDTEGVKQLLAEADGGMVPIVEFNDSPEVKDRRKTRKCCWKEAKLCFSRDMDSSKAHFRATMKSVELTGIQWFSSAVEAGMGCKSDVHSVGDGALWIQDLVSEIFSGQGTYLIDFYHVSEYLSAAAPACIRDDQSSDQWLKEQQSRLKSGNLYLVLQELERSLYENDSSEDEHVRACYRYLTNRLNHLDYLGAILDEKPIGSGEIESAHRHVVQKRMKKAGAWWKLENAEKMLQILVLRANDLWKGYWETQGCSAASEKEITVA